MGIALDITDRNKHKLPYSSQKSDTKNSQTIFPGVIYQFRLTPEGCINYPYISAGCVELFGTVAEDIMADANCLMEIMHPDDIVDFQQLVAESARNMTPKLWEGRAVRVRVQSNGSDLSPVQNYN